MNEVLEEILDYWYIIEFLNQSNFPYIERKEAFRKSTMVIGDKIDQRCSLAQTLKNDEKMYPTLPEVSDNLEFCLGKIERETCIKSIYNIYGKSDDRIEKTPGRIALIGLQISSLQRYVPTSFYISPIIWTMHRMHTMKDKPLSECINEADYKKDMSEFDKALREKEEITIEDIQDCFEKVIDKYIKELPHMPKISFEGLMIYQRFKNDEFKQKTEETLGYSNLSMSFFTKDLKFTKESVLKSDISNKKFMIDFVAPYISCAYDNSSDVQRPERIDILKDSKECRRVYEEILSVRNAPLGKWPSQYTPSLMQQFAINLSIQRGQQALSHVAVNGPPGSGKTTMLKEIIADSIVKKAIAMTKYEDSDDAFSEHNFKYGSKMYNGYHSISSFNHYYSLDDEICKYSILVASSNNSAVENITKELPNTELLCKNVETKNEKTTNQIALKEIHDLFSENHKDIYYTKHAQALFENKNDTEKFWGLISAPLGNRRNLSQFIKVLNQIYFECLCKNDYIKEHKKLYKEAINKFIEQLDIVMKLGERLNLASTAKKDYESFVLHQQKKISMNLKHIEDNLAKSVELSERIKTCKQDSDSLSLDYEKCEEDLNARMLELDEINNTNDSFKKELEVNTQKIKELESSRKFVDFLYSLIKKETMNDKEIKSLYESGNIIEERIKEIVVKLQIAENKLHLQKEKLKNLKEDLEKKDQLHKQYERELENLDNANSELNHLIDDIQGKIDIYETEYNNWLEAVCNNPDDYENFGVLSDEFWEDFFGKDIEKGTKAHLLNPWISNHYNREREKLFYYALIVNKEFILSSYRARCNIKNSLMMWTHSEGDEVIKFHELDRVHAYSCLLQTIFVMVPVISTTFASVGKFLEDVHKPLSMGTLIIDEAGQAQPHMAMGAMIRSRKAIIVGDPKQVEPVVTDDLNAIKNLIKNDVNASYSNKTLSVQQFADQLTPYGTYYDSSRNGETTWVGCPLVVHRRCISPMFEISNRLSYNNVMKQQTMQPKDSLINQFAFSFSQWVDIPGKEKDHLQKNHYVPEQGKYVVNIIEKAFKKLDGKEPNLFIISPFNSVVEGVKKEIKDSSFYIKNRSEMLDSWLKNNCGTVHTFQGKEANEVIFLLGCDIDSKSAVSWVNANIINVAVTRAKYRLCIIGEYRVWRNNYHMTTVKGIIDAYILEQLNKLKGCDVTDERVDEVTLLQKSLPDIDEYIQGDDESYDINLYGLIKGMKAFGHHLNTLTDTELKEFQLTESDLANLDFKVKSHLIAGIKIDSIFKNLNHLHINFKDKSLHNLFLCKAMETHLRDNFIDTIKHHYGEETRDGRIDKDNGTVKKAPRLKKMDEKNFTIGVIATILSNRCNRLADINCTGNHDSEWWLQYTSFLRIVGKKRNGCCHIDEFTEADEKELRNLLFDKKVFIDSKVGKKLIEKQQ